MVKVTSHSLPRTVPYIPIEIRWLTSGLSLVRKEGAINHESLEVVSGWVQRVMG